jgi:lipoprotein LpqH
MNTSHAGVKRGAMITLAGAAILAAALAGCSSNGHVASTSASNTKVLIDGQDQKVQGNVACVRSDGTVKIAIGGVATGVGAMITDANPPQVQSVGLGSVNGLSLGWSPAGQGSAQATKDGSTYKITGIATGADMSNPMAGPVSKPFEIEVSCP